MGITSELPGELLGWLLRGCISALTISALQLTLSMRIRSFAAPIGIGLCAVFIGLGMYVIHLGLFFPHSLLTTGMGVLSQTSLSPGEDLLFIIINLLYLIIISAGAIRRMGKSDVVA